jgi:predicted dehydrogenase
VDAVLVASPSDTHAEISVAALSAGKHLLVEKPIALTLEDADRLCEAEQWSKKIAAVGLFLRHSDLFTALRENLSRVGHPITVTSAFHNHIARRRTVSGYERQRARGGGALFDLAYHHFDLYAWLLDSPLVAVDCRIETRDTEDDVAHTLVTLANGVRVAGSFSSATYNENRIDIYGDAGRLMADIYRTTRPRFRPVTESNERRVMREALEAFAAVRVGVNGLPGRKLQPFVAQLKAFYAAATGQPSSLPRVTEGRAALRVVAGAYESARKRCEVVV